jgi:hypothetical protein
LDESSDCGGFFDEISVVFIDPIQKKYDQEGG